MLSDYIFQQWTALASLTSNKIIDFAVLVCYGTKHATYSITDNVFFVSKCLRPLQTNHCRLLSEVTVIAPRHNFSPLLKRSLNCRQYSFLTLFFHPFLFHLLLLFSFLVHMPIFFISLVVRRIMWSWHFQRLALFLPPHCKKDQIPTSKQLCVTGALAGYCEMPSIIRGTLVECGEELVKSALCQVKSPNRGIIWLSSNGQLQSLYLFLNKHLYVMGLTNWMFYSL